MKTIKNYINFKLNLQIHELNHTDGLKVKPNRVSPFWPNLHKENEKLCVLIQNEESESTKPVWFNSKHSTSLSFATKEIKVKSSKIAFKNF